VIIYWQFESFLTKQQKNSPIPDVGTGLNVS
jgi:hypothetical protein